MSRKNEIDMTRGPLLGKIIAFALPLVATNVLQLLYNAADMVVVGRFDGSTALAAVGSTSSLIQLIINLFMGLSTGTSVAVARHKGAGEETEVSRTVHTSILVSIISGLFVGAVGLAISKKMLILMETPPTVLPQSLTYIRIYFLGIPFMMLVNFGAGIHRAVGDTKRPLYFLSVSGLLNVGLNVVFVLVLHMGVAGVAAATVISQALAAFLIVLSLCNADGCYRLDLRRLCIDGKRLAEILRVGIPAGVQGSLFSISNVLIQSSINSFGEAAMAAHTAAVGIEGFMNAGANSVADAATNFTGQNMGARKYDRVRKVCRVCSAAEIAICALMGTVMLVFGRELLGIYNKEPEVIELGMNRVVLVGATYFTYALMQVFAGSLRGMGRSLMPMIVSVLGICGLRIVYIFTVFPHWHTLMGLYVSYPVSWAASWIANMLCYFIVLHLITRKQHQCQPEQ